MQTVNFASLPNQKPQEYIFKLVELYRFIQQQPNLKAFKRYLREQDLMDKERFEALMDFLQITAVKGKPVTSGKFLKKVFEADTPVDRQRAVFKYLSEKNEILIKYVMDGLAERLYSTNELYRYITSYVYPGDYITLVNFRAWMDWLQSTEHIRMIGIRWGLSTLGEEAMSYIKIIDVDEILEEEEEGWEDEEDDEEEDEDEIVAEPAAPPIPEASPIQSPELTPPTPKPIPEPHSEPAPVTETPIPQPTITPAQQSPTPQPVQPSPVAVTDNRTERIQVVVQPLAPKTEETPLQLISEVFEEIDEEEDVDDFGESEPMLAGQLGRLRIDHELITENLQAIQRWWAQRPAGRMLSARDYGFSKESFDKEPAFALFRLSCLALSLFRFKGQLNVSRGSEAFGVLDQMGLFTNLYKSDRPVDEILEELFKAGLAQRPEFFSNLHFFLLLRRSIRALGDEGVGRLAAEESPEEVVSQLWQHLAQFSLHYEIIWILRELHIMGVFPVAALAEIGVVPLPKVRETAFKLGLIETPYAADFTSLVGTSKRLSRFFGPDDGFEAPLFYFEVQRWQSYDRSASDYFTRDQLGID